MAKKKLLLDECVPQKLRRHFAGEEVYTVAYMKWDGIKNGKLLTLAIENEQTGLIFLLLPIKTCTTSSI